MDPRLRWVLGTTPSSQPPVDQVREAKTGGGCDRIGQNFRGSGSGSG